MRERERCLLTHDLVDEDVGTVEGHGPVGPAKDPTEGLEGQGWKEGQGGMGGGGSGAGLEKALAAPRVPCRP